MARPKDPDLERLWQQRLRRQAARGLSVAAFCSREGVTVAQFYYWKRRLAASPSSHHRDLFVPVRVADRSLESRYIEARSVEVELPHQVRVRLESPPEPEWLGRVVAALAGLADREVTR